MTVSTLDLHKAIETVWDANDLDSTFKAYWDSSNITKDNYTVLNDGEGAPGQPLPYCIFEQMPGSTQVRMSRGKTSTYEIRDVPWQFRIHTRKTNNQSSKKIAETILNAMLRIFGGHPTVAPQPLTLDNGAVLYSQYQNDQGVRTGDEEHVWLLDYVFRLDVPQAHG